MGGIEVTIDSSDSRGIYDVATGIKLANGTHTLDGQTALNLARARGSKDGYGLTQSNFNREENQQLIIKAVLDKVLSLGTLSNPSTVLSLVDTLGDHVKTNFTTAELKTVIEVAKGMSGSAIVSLPLNESDNKLVTTGTYGSQSIVQPTAGLYEYSAIQAYIAQAFTPETTADDQATTSSDATQ